MQHFNLNFNIFGIKFNTAGLTPKTAWALFVLFVLFALAVFALLPLAILAAINLIAPNAGIEYGIWQYLGALVLLLIFGRKNT